MAPYFLLIFIVGLFASISRIKNSRFFNFPNTSVLIILSLFAGLRSSEVGTDTGAYVSSFSKIKNVDIFDLSTSRESGYLLFEKAIQRLHVDYWVMLFFIALVIVYLNLKVISALSYNVGLSTFLFIALGSYLFLFNGARQGLASGFYGLAVLNVRKENLQRYLLWIVIAFTFHRTVLIMVPFYFLIRQHYSLKNLFLTVFSTLLIMGFLNELLRFFPEAITEKYLAYENRGARGGELLTLFYVALPIVFVYVRRLIRAELIADYDIYLNMTILNGMIYLYVYLFGLDVNILRVTLYLSLSYLLLWPIIFKSVAFFRSLAGVLVFYIIHLMFFYVYLDRMSNLVPYQLNNTIINF
ncbi:EpsG family protein [Schleiferiaceae bacterium]|nr:EpsG family protein [Schleiferiaceae bacterium]